MASRREATLVLTIDAGGSSVKATVLCTRMWRVLACARSEYRALYLAPHHAEFDTDQWWAVIQETCAAAVAQAAAPPDSYLAITCTAMRSSFVLLDGAGNPLAPGVLNLDGRGTPYLAEIRDALGADALYMLTGHWPAAPLGLGKLLWFKDCRPELWSRIRHIMQMHDWMLYRLCGEMTSEPSSASMGQLLDVAQRCWATGLLDVLGIDPALFPPLRDGGAYLGGLEPEVAQAIGLPAGMPVHVGGGDTHVCCLGVDAVGDGDVVIVGGSTTPIQFTASTPLCDTQHRPWVSAHLWPNRWAIEMNAGITGLTYTWLRDLCFSVQPAAAPSYERLDALAAQAPLGAHGLLVTAANPYWREDIWNRMPPATLFALTPHHGLDDVARATMESTCYAVRSNLEGLEAVHGAPFTAVTFTGGAAQSPLWAQMLADVLGAPIRVVEVPEASAIGGGRLVLKNHPHDWGGPLPARHYQPDAVRHADYQPYYDRYRTIFRRLLETFGEG